MNAARHSLGGGGGSGIGRLAPILFDAKSLFGVSQLVGDDQRSKQQQPRLANLPDAADELGDFGFNILTQSPDTRLLPVLAGDCERAAVDRQAYLSHVSYRAATHG
jgi:hypothetical protein